MKIGAVLVSIFLLPFAAVGVFAGYAIVHHLIRAHELTSWEPAPAQIRSVREGKYPTKRSSSSQETILAEYGYDYKGKKYQGDRVGIVDEGGLGIVFRSREAELRQVMEQHGTWTCYVNPQNPDEAVLYTGLEWDHLLFLGIFATIFGGVGLGGFGLTIRGIRRSKVKQRLSSLHPTEPWRWRSDWDLGMVESSQRLQTLGIWAFAILWNGISMPISIAVLDEARKSENMVALFVLIFPLIGLGAIAVAINSTARTIRFGGATLRLTKNPGVIGGTLSGLIRLSRPVVNAQNYNLRLQCTERVRTRDSSQTITVFEMQLPPVLVNGMLSEVPFEFKVPPGCKASSDSPQIEWNVELRASLPGPDLVHTFEVPMFDLPGAATASGRSD